MADFRIDRALSEMRALSGQQTVQPKPEEAPPLEDFSSMLRTAVEQVNDRQAESGSLRNSFLRGEDVQLTDVMISSQKAKISFEAMKEVRNRLLEAYQEISKMQV